MRRTEDRLDGCRTSKPVIHCTSTKSPDNRRWICCIQLLIQCAAKVRTPQSDSTGEVSPRSVCDGLGESHGLAFKVSEAIAGRAHELIGIQADVVSLKPLACVCSVS